MMKPAGITHEAWEEMQAWLRRQAERDALKLEDLFSRADALTYVNERLEAMGGSPIVDVTFNNHIYDRDVGEIEPLVLGVRTGGFVSPARGEYAMQLLFTRRMLDEYVANRAYNHRARPGNKRVTRPTKDEEDAFLAGQSALDYINEELAARRVNFEMSAPLLQYYRRIGRVPYRLVGKLLIYRVFDLERFVEDIAAAGGWDESKRGRKRAVQQDHKRV